MTSGLKESNPSTTTASKDRVKKRKHFFRRKKSERTPDTDKLMHVKSFEKDLERAKVF